MSYELKTDKSGQFIFNLKAANGQVILTSESYTQKSSALAGIDSVRANGPDDANYERKTSSASQPYFVLKAKNGGIIGRSEMYSSESARENGIASVKTNCPSTDVDDKT